MAKTADDIIESSKFGPFSFILIFISGLIFMQGSSHNFTIGLISPELRCKWNLTSIETSLSSSSVFLGMGIGSFFWGYMCDRHGRKSIFIAAAFVTSYMELLSTATSSFTWFLILRFMMGFGLGSIELTTCYVAEFISKQHRGKSVIFVQLFSAFGNIYTSAIGLLVMASLGWRAFLILTTLPSILFLMLSTWLPESVRYLQNTDNYDDLMKVLNRISICNKVVIKPPVVPSTQSNSKRGDLKMLAQRQYFWKMSIMAIVLISSHAGYQSLGMLNTEILKSQDICHRRTNKPTLNANNTRCTLLNQSDYVQNIFVTLSDIPGILLPFLLVDIIGRKTYVFPAFIIAGFCFLSLNLVCSSMSQLTVVMFVLRFLLSGLNQISHIIAVELFPTVVRASALGILSGFAKLTLIGLPFLVQTLFDIFPLYTTLVLAGLCFMSASLILFLPETKTLHLANS